MQGRSIYRRQVLDARRDAWLGEASLSLSAGSWWALGLAATFGCIASGIVVTSTYDRYAWVTAAPWTPATASPGSIVASRWKVEAVRPALLRDGQPIGIDQRSGGVSKTGSATIAGCVAIVDRVLAPCDRAPGTHDVLLAIAARSDGRWVDEPGPSSLRVRLPVDRQRLLDWLIQPSRTGGR